MILEQVAYEIHNTDFGKKLIAGIVLTGGGASIRNIVSLTEFLTGLDARIGTPHEHLKGTITDEMKNPMHATGIGLILKGFQYMEEEDNHEEKKDEETQIETVEKEKPDKNEEKKNSLAKRIRDFLGDIISDSNY